MATYKFFGRTTDFKGNTLWEIVSNLKNFGVGRVLVRSTFERYPEKSYMRIVKVEALPSPIPKKNFKYEIPPEVPKDLIIKSATTLNETRRVKVFVEKVFRGKHFEKPVCIESASYKPDYRLLSKKEEAEYCQVLDKKQKLIARYMELPPLLKEFVMKETGQTDVKMKVAFKPAVLKTARLAKDGETPDMEIPIGLGTPHPTGKSLYEGLKL